MTSENDCFDINSTFVVFGNDGDATPVPLTESFFDDLKNRYSSFFLQRILNVVRGAPVDSSVRQPALAEVENGKSAS